MKAGEHMGNDEKILSVIRQESEAKIKALDEDAEKVYLEITGEAGKKAQEIRRGGEHKVQLQADNLLKAFQSRADLEKRNALLRTKRKEIEKTIEMLHDHIISMNEKDYFKYILRLIKNLEDTNGVLFFCSKDLKRMPKNFSLVLVDHNIEAKISETPDDSIEGGFILKHGDIEENMSIASLIEEKREQLEDMIGSELFKD